MPDNDSQVQSGAPAAGTQDAAPAASAANGMDYDARLQSDPQFAVKMAKEHQARADRAVQEAQSLRKFRETVGDSLARAVEQIGGDAAWTHLQTVDKLMSDASFAEAYRNYQQTGTWNYGKANGAPNNGSATVDTDEYLTPEEKEIRQLKSEMAAIKQELIPRLGNVEATAGRNALQGHLEKVFESYAFDKTQVEQVKEHMSNAIDQMQRSGNIQALQELQKPTAYKMVRTMALAAFEDDAPIQQAAERARLRKQGLLGRLATDGPSATNGRGEPPPSFKSAAEAIQWARANPDAHDSY